VGDAAAGTGLRLGHDLLAASARLARGGHLNKDSSPFWELPQPKPQEILTGLQNETPVDMSEVTTVQKTITQDGRTVKLYIMKPQQVEGKPGVLLFIHGGVWIVGNFKNHQRLLRDDCLAHGSLPNSAPRLPRRHHEIECFFATTVGARLNT